MTKLKISAIIIDDEEHCRNSLSKQLEWSCPEVQIIGTAASVKSGQALIKEVLPELIFLDIEMPDGSGFDLIAGLKDFSIPVIFTTAYDEYALEAFKVNAIAYLLKPIDGDELIKAIDKINFENKDYFGAKLEGLMQYLRSQDAGAQKIAFPNSDGLEFVNVDDIVRCESDGSYCHIFLKDRPKLFLAKTLKQVSELISSEKFVRVHHSHLINLDYIQKYIKGKGGQIIMDDGQHIPVSRTRKDGFLEKF